MLDLGYIGKIRKEGLVLRREAHIQIGDIALAELPLLFEDHALNGRIHPHIDAEPARGHQTDRGQPETDAEGAPPDMREEEVHAGNQAGTGASRPL